MTSGWLALRCRTTSQPLIPGIYDDKTLAAGHDRIQIDVDQVYELRDWAHRLGVSPRRLEEAVETVGPQLGAVEKYLGGSSR